MISNKQLLEAISMCDVRLKTLEVKLGMPKNTIYNLVRADRPMYKYPTLRKDIINYLKMSADNLLLVCKYADTDYYPTDKKMKDENYWYFIDGLYYFCINGETFCTPLMEINFNGKIIKFNKFNSGPLVITGS